MRVSRPYLRAIRRPARISSYTKDRPKPERWQTVLISKETRWSSRSPVTLGTRASSLEAVPIEFVDGHRMFTSLSGRGKRDSLRRRTTPHIDDLWKSRNRVLRMIRIESEKISQR